MPDDFVLRDRLYEAVLELAGIPRSQFDMLLSVPDPIGLAKSIQQLILNSVDPFHDARAVVVLGRALHTLDVGAETPVRSKEVDHAIGKGATGNR
jgi:hypothetical protein